MLSISSVVIPGLTALAPASRHSLANYKKREF